MDPQGLVLQGQLFGMAACVFQHEFDHLEGINISEIGLEIDEDFDKATEEERLEVINMYLDSLDIKQKEINKEIEEDKDLKQLSDGIKFIEKVQKGEVQLEKVPMSDSEIKEIKELKKELEQKE